MDNIISRLTLLREESYQKFQSSLIPTVDPSAILGVRTPKLRKIAKELFGTEMGKAFLNELPHSCFEENQIHGFMISEIKNFEECLIQTERFLPYIDNWATCDQTAPKVFSKHKQELLPAIDRWLDSDHTYTVRFAIGMLMRHYLDADYQTEYTDRVCAVGSDDYYIRMEQAWYMATALAKQWDSVIPYLEKRILPKWTHNKTIRKAKESYRITTEQKDYLSGLVIQ
ncbi:MAG: DNA alkylation repair protein [Clostridia bacterium]|nr:DNA alkylation repair protein [Clostridia bacterium]